MIRPSARMLDTIINVMMEVKEMPMRKVSVIMRLAKGEMMCGRYVDDSSGYVLDGVLRQSTPISCG